MSQSAIPTPEQIGACVDAVREAAPLTQCMTNEVVTGFTANVLLAIGASPAMVASLEEGPIFTGVADGLLINVGTVTAPTVEAMKATARARHEAGRTWCLDPVAVGVLPQRTQLARDLLEFAPTVVRGNASEIIGLVGDTGAGRGVDAGNSVDESADAAKELLLKGVGSVAVSGAVDAVHVPGMAAPIRLANGHELMTRVTGVGCSLGAMVAAYLPVAQNPALAACAATSALSVAAETAALNAAGPGSFAVELLDALWRTDGAAVAAAVQISHDAAASSASAGAPS